jgi:hypothetical protein
MAEATPKAADGYASLMAVAVISAASRLPSAPTTR